jgi:hypothetical protein
MDRTTAALLRSNNSSRHTIRRTLAAVAEKGVEVETEASSSSAMAISATPVSATTTTATTVDAAAINADAADSARRTDHAVVGAEVAVVVVVEAAD